MNDAYLYTDHVSAVPGAPLLLVFHGTGGDENQFFGLGRQLLPSAHLVSPRGDVSEHGAARFFRRTGEGRYDMDDLARATRTMAAFVESRVAVLKPSAVLGLGYSNGANILANVLIERPGLFQAAVLLHPLIPFTPQASSDLSAVSVLITAGRRDPICPPELTTSLGRHLTARGARVETHWQPGGHEIAESELVAAARFLNTSAIGETER